MEVFSYSNQDDLEKYLEKELGISFPKTDVITLPKEGSQFYNSRSDLLPRTDIFRSQFDALKFLEKLIEIGWGYSSWGLVEVSFEEFGKKEVVVDIQWETSFRGRTSVYWHDDGDIPEMEIRNGRMIVYD